MLVFWHWLVLVYFIQCRLFSPCRLINSSVHLALLRYTPSNSTTLASPQSLVLSSAKVLFFLSDNSWQCEETTQQIPFRDDKDKWSAVSQAPDNSLPRGWLWGALDSINTWIALPVYISLLIAIYKGDRGSSSLGAVLSKTAGSRHHPQKHRIHPGFPFFFCSCLVCLFWCK